MRWLPLDITRVVTRGQSWVEKPDLTRVDEVGFADLHPGSGHGWGGANYVIWNGTGSLMLQSPPTAENFAFGFVGKLVKPRPGPLNGWFVSLGQHVAPRSLYLQQLEERRGANAVQNIAAEK